MSGIFVLEIIVAITAYILREDLQETVEREIQLSMYKYDDYHQGVMKTWDVIQHDVSF